MKHLLNVGHIQFDLWMAGAAQQIVGKMIKADDVGCSILKESDGTEQYYAWATIQHACNAP